MSKTLLLTGATGFLGSHILNGFLKQYEKIIITTRPKSNLSRISHLSNRIISFQLTTDKKKINDIFHQYEIEGIINTATEYGKKALLSEVLDANLIFPINLLELGIKNGIQFFINTDTFFGKEENGKQQYLNTYTKSKQILADFLKVFDKEIAIVNMRLEHVFGENDSEHKFVTGTLRKMLLHKEIDFTDGTQKRDFIYVTDVVEAYLKVVSSINSFKGYYEFEVGTGESISVKEFVELLFKFSGSMSILNFGKLSQREGEIKDSRADNEGLKYLGWNPKYSLENAIKKLILFEKELNNC